MKILLFGANGQVGREFVSAVEGETEISLTALTRSEVDLMGENAGANAIKRARPDIVINAAAWTQVDKAETEPAAARRLNSDAPGELAAAVRAIGARFIHLSTDYVFSGAGSAAPLCEDAPAAPLNVYGATKLDGERQALNADPDAVIVRTSWVHTSHGSNFVRTMIRLSASQDTVAIVADQIGGPTPARAIAEACLKIARRQDGPGGIYHFQGAPATNWADFAAAIFAAAGRDVKIKRISTSNYPTTARRPLYAVLNCSKILRDYGIDQPDWRRDLPAIVGEILKRGDTQH